MTRDLSGSVLVGLGLLLAGCPTGMGEPDDDTATIDDDDATIDDDDSGPDDDDSSDPDGDGDGFLPPEDCDDDDPEVHPGAEEVCNGLDDDCDGDVDDLPVPDAGPQIVFAVVGDFGYGGSNEAAVSSLVRSWNPDFVTTNGDNNYPSGSPSTMDAHVGFHYQQYIGNYIGIYGPGSEENRFFPTMGNHDWYGGHGAPHLVYFSLPGNERYYEFVRGPVHLFALSSDTDEPDGTTATSVQGQWLQAALAESTSPFRVVYFHHPPWSAGMHGNTSRMQWPFDEWGAQVWMAGHDHDYERVYTEGVTGLVNGSGGAPLRRINRWEDFSRVQFDQRFGAQRVVADDRSITFEFIDIDDNLIDAWTLTAGARVEDPSTPLVHDGSDWLFWQRREGPGWGWMASGFDDDLWSVGTAPIGFGGLEATKLDVDDGDLIRPQVVWFRTVFEVEQVCAVEQLRLRLLRDDGAVVYLNGQEILRSNMPLGPVGPETLAASAIDAQADGRWLDTWLDPLLLRQGANVLAVEVHQHSPLSDDLLFDLELLAYTP